MTVFLKQTFNPLLAKLKGIEGQTWLMLGLFVVLLIGMIEPSFADMFEDATTKAKLLKTGLVKFGKGISLVGFVISVIGGITGRINWTWAGLCIAVALLLIAADNIGTFFGMG